MTGSWSVKIQGENILGREDVRQGPRAGDKIHLQAGSVPAWRLDAVVLFALFYCPSCSLLS